MVPLKETWKQTLVLDDLIPVDHQACQENQPDLCPIPIPGIVDLVNRIMGQRLALDISIPHPSLCEEEVLSKLQWTTAATVEQSPPSKFCIFTDGSKLWNADTLALHAAWAFVVCAKWDNDNEPFVLGFQSGSVCIDTQHPDWLGATEVDSYQAEVMALTYATLWLCQEPLAQAGVPCEFVADSTSALHGADGTYQIHHPCLGQVLRPLQKMAEGLVCVEHRWQKAHIGDPHNELADHLAKCAARQPQQTVVPSPLDLQHDITPLAWAWMVTHQAKTSRWPDVTEDAVVLPVPAPLSSCDIPVELSCVGQQSLHLSLQLTTCNISSFKDSDEKASLSWTGRAELVRTQAIETGSQVMAFQETRRTFTGQWTSAHFLQPTKVEVGYHFGSGMTFLLPMFTRTMDGNPSSFEWRIL